MTDIRFSYAMTPSVTQRDRQPWLTSRVSRIALALIVIGAVGSSFALVDVPASSRAVANAGNELTRLLRFMAVIKGGMALAAVGAVLWRLGSDVSLGRFVTYGTCCAAMAAGPGLIWGMAHVGLGALLLHGGLFALLVLLWCDPAIPVRLETALAARRAHGREQARP